MGTTVSPLLQSLGSTPSTTAVGAQANDSQMNMFLKLLTAQLQNQDPSNPTDPTQFVSQLAQFSSVEQLVQSNTTLTSMSKTLSGLTLGQYSGLINHQVSAAVNTVSVPVTGTAGQMGFNVSDPSLTNIQIQVTNSSGAPVRSIPVTSTSGNFTFDGLNSSGQPLPSGQYGINLVGSTAQGAVQSAGTLSTSGTVSSIVQGTNGSWELQFNDGRQVDASTVTSVL
jgi:flagellar basal-body rod modification protein FlgD